MILADTSVWIDHLRADDKTLAALLDTGRVVVHPFVTGELALGNLRQREVVLASLQNLPQAVTATDDEVMGFIDRHTLAGVGLGYIDAHLLASTQLTVDASLWTRDKRLLGVASRLGIAARLDDEAD